MVASEASTCHFYAFAHSFLSHIAIMDNEVFSGSLVLYAVDVVGEYLQPLTDCFFMLTAQMPLIR